MDISKPKIEQIKPRPFPEFEEVRLENGARLIIIREPGWKVFRLEACFLAGRPFEHKRSVAKSTAELLREGSAQYNSLALAEHFERNGASIKSKSGIDTSHVLMHGPVNRFQELFPVFREIVTSPSFSEKELSKYKKNQKERLKADLSVNEVIAYRNFTEGLFGENHPYGYNSLEGDYEAIDKRDLEKHFERCYSPGQSVFLLSGGVNEEMITNIRHSLSSWENPSTEIPKPRRKQSPRKGTEIYEKVTHYQASIRMGRLLFSYEHEDHPYAQIANTLLGGYFGSRLMRKIRQEKGLSYNIFSVIEPMMFDGYWMIGTETSHQNVEEVIGLIKQELRRLAEEKIKAREIKMMKNYLIGNSLQYFEGAFNKSDFLRHHLFEVGKAKVYEPMMSAIQEMDPEKIRAVAERYFHDEDLLTVVVK